MILIVDEMHPSLMSALTASGISFDYQPNFSISDTLKHINSFNGLVVRSKFFIDRPFLDAATTLKFIARAGSGTDNIDAEYAQLKGVEIINAPEALCDAVAEHTLGMMLALHHKITLGNMQVKNGIWKREYNRGKEIMGSTVGIIGYGHTGSAVAKKLHGFGVNVITYDKYKMPHFSKDGRFFFDDHATSTTLETIYEQADILTLHLPLTEETRMWADKKFFDQFKKPIYFINTSRGGIVKTADLKEALESGKIIAAALDVLEHEPPWNKTVDFDLLMTQLSHMEQVIMTPHVAGWSAQSYRRISEVLAAKIIRFYKK